MRICFSLIFIGIFLLISCQDESLTLVSESEPSNEPSFVNVDARLKPYFETFQKEASIRGLAYDLDALGIIGQIINISEDGVAGTCRYGDHFTNEVSVDQDYWNRSTEIRREFVVFHELGHCILMRDHLEDSNSQGLCVSIMRSGLGNCRDAYNSINRKAYLDELFSRNNGPT